MTTRATDTATTQGQPDPAIAADALEPDASSVIRPSFGRILGSAALALLALTLVCGALYPLAVTAIAQLAFPSQADGSLLRVRAAGGEGDRIVGSALIGQPFDDPRYFWSRPSATAPTPYNAAAGAGSNLGPTNPELVVRIQESVAALRRSDPQNQGPLPADLVTSSGSGLDPHISPASAEWQVTRVASARGLEVATVRRLVGEHVEGRSLGFLGEPRVNVLELNLALDTLQGR